MKSAYELAMERLNASDPTSTKPLSAEKKKALADLDTKYKAKVAEREIFLQKQLDEAREKRDPKEYVAIEQQMVSERIRLQEELEESKEHVRKQ